MASHTSNRAHPARLAPRWLHVRARVRLAMLLSTSRPRAASGHRPARRRRDREERGAATAFLVLLAVALLAVAGLVIDGGYTLGAQREAMGQAEQAARVGSDALSESSLRSGGAAQVNPAQAVAAAQNYLHSVGANGTVSVDGGEVTVTVNGSQDTALLSAVGVNSIDFKATATAVSIDEENQ